MRSRSLAAQHDAAVARRLELLTTELAAVRERDAVPDTLVRPAASWSPHGHTRIRAVPDLATDESDRGERSDGDDSGVGASRPPTTVRIPGRPASRSRPTTWVRPVINIGCRFALAAYTAAV